MSLMSTMELTEVISRYRYGISDLDTPSSGNFDVEV
jgi:hypothetical protein